MINLAVVGVGKIALEEHIPSINHSKKFRLVSTVSPSQRIKEITNFTSIDELDKSDITVNAVSICTPPEPRYELAKKAIDLGYHVLLEKPPCVKSSDCKSLLQAASSAGVSIFAAWHSKFASSVSQAYEWIRVNGYDNFEIIWREDVRKWHPQQYWISKNGGFGVVDAGINSLSLLSALLDTEFYPSQVKFYKPLNWDTPLATSFELYDNVRLRGTVKFDWRNDGDEIWEIRISNEEYNLVLSDGGHKLCIDGSQVSIPSAPVSEYNSVYERFGELVNSGESEMDIRPVEIQTTLFELAEWFELPHFYLDE